jgi:hypothetical protein
MNLAVVHAAKWYRKFVTDLETQTAWLHETKMMGIGGLTGTNEARLLRDMMQMGLVAMPLCRADWNEPAVAAVGLCASGLVAFVLLDRGGLSRNVGRLRDDALLPVVLRKSS